MSRFVNPQPRYTSDTGQPLIGGKLFFFTTDTVTPRDTYSDAAFTIENTNPVILDSNGRPQTDIFLDGVYKVVLRDANDNLIWEKDPVGGAIGVAAFDDWISDATYDRGQIVTGSDGNYYVSLTNGNFGLDPTIEAGDWERVQLLVNWRADVNYQLGDFSIGSDSVLYESQSNDNLNNDPVTDAVNWSSVRDYAGVANGFATLDADGLVPSSQIPPIAITDVYVVANQAARLALDAQVGDIAVQQDVNIAYILQSLPASTNSNWIQLGAQGFGTAAFRDVGTGADEIPDKEILDARLGTTGNLGTAAQQNIGTGANQVPDKEILDARLGTTGNLGTAATRNVGTGTGQVPEYTATGLSGYGYGGGADLESSSIDSYDNSRFIFAGSGATGNSTGNAIVGIQMKGEGASDSRKAQIQVNYSGADAGRVFVRTQDTTWGSTYELWSSKNLSPMTTNTTQTITAVKVMRALTAQSPSVGAIGFSVQDITRDEKLDFAIGVGESVLLHKNADGVLALRVNFTNDGKMRVEGVVSAQSIEVDGTITAPNVIATTTLRSDPKLKTKRVKADVTREQLESLTLWYFEWRQDRKGVPDHLKGKADIGVMADAVQKVFPECVVEHEGYLTVDYAKLGVCLTLADMKLRREGK